MSATTAYKAHARELFAAISASRTGWRAGLGFFTEDAEWRHARLGELSIATLVTHGDAVLQAAVSPMTFDVKDVTGEGDKVTLECTSHCELRGGVMYDQTYCFCLWFTEQGLIRRVHEYADTKLAAEVWGKILPGPAPASDSA